MSLMIRLAMMTNSNYLPEKISTTFYPCELKFENPLGNYYCGAFQHMQAIFPPVNMNIRLPTR